MAAKIGTSLLEQNKELLDKNEFLEESIASSNEAISQLRHQLRQRSSFFNTFIDYDEDEVACIAQESLKCTSTSPRIEEQIKKLEIENQQLKSEVLGSS